MERGAPRGREETTMRRALLAILLGGVAMFAWNAAAHMATPLGHTGLKKLPAEGLVLEGMRRAVPESGLYFFPWTDDAAKNDPAAREAHAAAIKKGPSGILVYRASDGPLPGPKTFAMEFATNLLCAATIVAVLKLGGAGFRSFGNRLLAAACMGIFAGFAVHASNYVWWSYPDDFVLASLAIEAGGGIAAGLPIAAILKPSSRG
jgi:hypothetical protein